MVTMSHARGKTAKLITIVEETETNAVSTACLALKITEKTRRRMEDPGAMKTFMKSVKIKWPSAITSKRP
jgi:hypothetical protein